MTEDPAEDPVPVDLLSQLSGFELYVSTVEDLRTTNLGVPGTDFALGVGQLWLEFSNERSGESERVLRVSPGREKLLLAFERPTALPDSADAETSAMVNRWLSGGDRQISQISVAGSDVLFVFSDMRFLAVCGSLDAVGLLAGQSVETYNQTAGAITI